MVMHTPYPEYKDSGVEWLDMVPSHWVRVPIKYMATKRGTLFLDGDWIESKDLSADGVRYITTGNVGEGVYKEQGAGYITEEKFAELNCTEVFEGDLLISRLNSPIGRACIVPNLGERIVTSVDNVILRPNSEYHKNFLRYAFSSEAYFAHTGILSRGATMQRISRGLLGNIRVPLPPLGEQQIIAAFLDHETAKIDRLIARQERLIELLKEKRQAVISHAVTKGLNPDAPMKDSGVEWLGEVPAHWDVKSIKRLTVVKRGASPRPIDDPKYFDEEGRYAWVRIADSTASGGRLHVTTQRLSDLGSSLSVPLQPGDLFLSIAGTVGLPCITEIPACIHDGFVYFPGWREDREFLFYIFQAGECYKGLGKFGTQLNLNTDTVGFIKIGVPPRGEQELIVGYLHEKLSKLDNLVAKVAQAVTLLQEHRTTLISAAVTGKIDVRGWQQPSIEPQAAATAASA